MQIVCWNFYPACKVLGETNGYHDKLLVETNDYLLMIKWQKNMTSSKHKYCIKNYVQG